MMRIGREGDVVLFLQPQALHKTLRRVFLALVLKLFRTFAQIRIVDRLQTLFPHRTQFLQALETVQVTAGYFVQLAMNG